MANRTSAVHENVPGNFFVDTSCINCDACRQLAPAIFGDSGDYSFVKRQPETVDEDRHACQALLTCPTGSIGATKKGALNAARHDFPLLLADNVYFCGYNSGKSFGGNSYFVRHRDGNWLVDAPRYLRPLAKRLTELGGVRYIFLTHRDDVADAGKYARRFRAQRIIHREELAAQPDAEIVVEGTVRIRLTNDFVIIPTPGHTAGHCALLHHEEFLFTGDHLWWDPDLQRLNASREYCWWSWPEQIRSLERLQEVRFSWVLPGHGQRIHCPAPQMQEFLGETLRRLSS